MTSRIFLYYSFFFFLSSARQILAEAARECRCGDSHWGELLIIRDNSKRDIAGEKGKSKGEKKQDVKWERKKGSDCRKKRRRRNCDFCVIVIKLRDSFRRAFLSLKTVYDQPFSALKSLRLPRNKVRKIHREIQNWKTVFSCRYVFIYGYLLETWKCIQVYMLQTCSIFFG